MIFSLEGKEFELRSIDRKPCKMIISNGMTKLFKKGQNGVIAQLCSIYVQTSKPSIPLDLQKVIDNHSKVFAYISKGIPPTQECDHAIHLIPWNLTLNISPYKYPMPRRVRLSIWLKKCVQNIESSTRSPLNISFLFLSLTNCWMNYIK